MELVYPGDLPRSMVYYFYLPAIYNKPAELIEVLHGDSLFIQVPMRDEDRQLKAFFRRPITAAEVANFGEWQTWQIFTSWQELEEDHARWKVPDDVLLKLRKYKSKCYLSEAVLV